ncbi:MAG: Xaa-Pro peptidase family protein [Candidatus Omnitrophota bacterium]|nr:Xaa-Pro peptidase family protein [Candidatus Omnitrophota bacterium]
MNLKPRIHNVYAELKTRELDGLLISLPANITYLTGYLSRDSYLLFSDKKSVYFTDSRYITEAKAALSKEVSLKQINGSFFKCISQAITESGLGRVGFEERHLPYAEYEKIRSYLGSTAELVPTHGVVEEIRQFKDSDEIARIKSACRITRSALKFAQKNLAPGKKEIEVVGDLERFIRYHGGGDSAFEIIVAGGPNSALPHHIPGNRKLKSGEPVLIDIGVDIDGYKSDLTRVFFLGKINVRVRQVYDIVLSAQKKALGEIRPGIAAQRVDNAGRKFITDNGFGEFFGHSFGHGVGLEVHEEPHISPKSQEILKPGMVFTLEPAVYLPGEFGIRIEDMVEVRENGYRKL